jgi:phosphopantetheinyl transferase (holo-ACP synthase)
MDRLCLRGLGMLLGAGGTGRLVKLNAGSIVLVSTRQGDAGSLAVASLEITRMRRLFAPAGIRAHLFDPDERRYCESRRDSAQRYAARLAAKLALRSLWPRTPPIPWLDMKVVHGPLGAPVFYVQGPAQWHRLLRAELSLTHDKELATAVLALRPRRAGLTA